MSRHVGMYQAHAMPCSHVSPMSTSPKSLIKQAPILPEMMLLLRPSKRDQSPDATEHCSQARRAVEGEDCRGKHTRFDAFTTRPVHHQSFQQHFHPLQVALRIVKLDIIIGGEGPARRHEIMVTCCQDGGQMCPAPRQKSFLPVLAAVVLNVVCEHLGSASIVRRHIAQLT